MWLLCIKFKDNDPEETPKDDAESESDFDSMIYYSSYHDGSSRGIRVNNDPMADLTDKLCLACTQGQMDRVHELLQEGATFRPDRDGRTPIHYAALSGHADIVMLLLQQGCNINAQDAHGCTALYRAATQGQVEVVRVLTLEGCSVDRPDILHGNTALHEAAWNGFSKTLELLIKAKANVLVTNKGGFTAIHLAAQNGHNESTRVLLYATANPDVKNNYGDTALHTAARYGHAGVTRIIISARCRLNEQNKNGDTALHIAAALKRRKITKLLGAAGIDIGVKNKQCETAIDVARRKEHPEIIVIITTMSKGSKSRRLHHRSTEHVEFKQYPDLEGPVIVADEDIQLKADKMEKEKKWGFLFRKKKNKDKENASQPKPAHPSQVAPVPRPPVKGFFNQYVAKEGVQYYRDLAGNLKQGPVGFIPTCQCMPSLKKLEQKVESGRDNVYDHIDASQRILRNKIEQLDKRTAQQVYAIDKLTKERLEAERIACEARIKEHLQNERGAHQVAMLRHDERLRGEINKWLHQDDDDDVRHHCDDSKINRKSTFFDVHQTENGRLFRSRSDETLSQSDYGGRHRKRGFYESRQAAMQQIRGWNDPSKEAAGQRDTYKPNNQIVNAVSSQIFADSQVKNRSTDGLVFEASPSGVLPRKPFCSSTPIAYQVRSPEQPMYASVPSKHMSPQVYSQNDLLNRSQYRQDNSPVIASSAKQRENSPYEGRTSVQTSRVNASVFGNTSRPPVGQSNHVGYDDSRSRDPRMSNANSGLDKSERVGTTTNPNPSARPGYYRPIRSQSNSAQQSECRDQGQRTAAYQPEAVYSSVNRERSHGGNDFLSNRQRTQSADGLAMASSENPQRSRSQERISSPQGKGNSPLKGTDNPRPGTIGQRHEQRYRVQTEYSARPPRPVTYYGGNSAPYQQETTREGNPDGACSRDLIYNTSVPNSGGARHNPSQPSCNKQTPPYHSTRHLYNNTPSATPNVSRTEHMQNSISPSKSEPALARLKKENSSYEANHESGASNKSANNDLDVRLASQQPVYSGQVKPFSYTAKSVPGGQNPAITHNREDSSSNPDSGYSSKIYGQRMNSNLSNATSPSNTTTPSSSFSVDHSVGTPNLSSPSQTSPYPHDVSTDSETQQSKQYLSSVSAHLQNRYGNKMNNMSVNRSSGAQSTINGFSVYNNSQKDVANGVSAKYSASNSAPMNYSAESASQRYSATAPEQNEIFMRGSDV